MVGKRVCWSRVESGSTVRRERIRVVHGEAATGSIILGVVLNEDNRGAQGLHVSGETETGTSRNPNVNLMMNREYTGKVRISSPFLSG